jgi:hypothetical protein
MPVWLFSFLVSLPGGLLLQPFSKWIQFFGLVQVTHIVCGWLSTRSKSALTSYEV